MKNISGLFLVGCSAIALAGCGPSDIASPGTGGDVIINNPAPSPGPSPTPGTGGNVTAAAGCPTIADAQGLSDQGTITGPTGTWRVCRLPALVRTSITLPKVAGLLYEMNGRVNVGCDGGFAAPSAAAAYTSTTVGCTTPLTADNNVTLTIAPGAILFGATGQSWLAVNRGNKINAVGTETQPIIFTSRDNVLGLSTDSSQGQWGGVVLLGRGITTDCAVGSVAANTCERNTEGAADLARFGGADNTYNAGRMSYVQIRYSGFVLGSNSELQALTTGAIGTETVLDHIQAHNSSDDGAEFFGGAINLKYYVATGADDDSLDVDNAAQANVQYALILQRAGRGDSFLEIDSNGGDIGAGIPRTKLTLANFTAVQSGLSADNAGNQAAMLLRGNADVSLINGVVVTPQNECIRLNGETATPVTLTASSVALQCASAKYISTGAGVDAAAAFAAGSKNNRDDFTPTLASIFINGANETGVAATDPKTSNAFFDTTAWIGAVRNAQDTWYAGWTCNSGTANFGSSSGACDSLPTT